MANNKAATVEKNFDLALAAADKAYAAADKPALAYIDNRCSYATNEVAINWNAPLAYLAAALEAIYNK